ncbi:hypothetical protein DRJ17_02360 [Candidatus Woesearchaeota archaeon]|nr:MAG: hypothetical protein DRJ17_02360 [Candidatus Woesearchaeota archaeon]
MYKIKQLPEDFIVKEINNITVKDKGRYSYWLLKKKNHNTISAIHIIANAIGKPLNTIGYAGNKDKNAVTEQIISIKNVNKKRVESTQLRNISLKFLGVGDEPVVIGMLEGNYFEIVVRNIESKPFIKKEFINLFGEQRFSKKNVDIGKAIVHGCFDKAAKLIAETDREYGAKKFYNANKNNPIAMIRLLPKSLIKLYVHAYQSKMWNDIAIEYIKNKKRKNCKIPIIGFGTNINNYNKDIRNIVLKIIKKENISKENFIIRQLPEISSEGGERDLFVKVNIEASRLEHDEINKGKKKIFLKFSLPKGSYATEIIRQIFI